MHICVCMYVRRAQSTVEGHRQGVEATCTYIRSWPTQKTKQQCIDTCLYYCCTSHQALAPLPFLQTDCFTQAPLIACARLRHVNYHVNNYLYCSTLLTLLCCILYMYMYICTYTCCKNLSCVKYVCTVSTVVVKKVSILLYNYVRTCM